MTTLRTLGSLNARIGSRMYGVRLVLHGPASAELSALNRLCLSAHSSTLMFSGGSKCFTAREIVRFKSRIAWFLVFIGRSYPAFPLPHHLRIDLGVVFVFAQRIEHLAHLRL